MPTIEYQIKQYYYRMPMASNLNNEKNEKENYFNNKSAFYRTCIRTSWN
ncbi:hypothetical protein EMIT036CA2_40347 [Chryseobacterium sp. IT-36CA2]